MIEAAGKSPEVQGRDRDRIVNISDGVFAIVITILVLGIQVPDIPYDQVSRDLPGRIMDLRPKFLGYVISLLVIDLYWQVHHRIFKPIRG